MEIIDIRITDISEMGQGIGRIDNMVVFVDDALPGDHVKAQITHKKKKYMKAKAVEIIDPSPDRTVPECPYVDRCGGCTLMGLDYSVQLDIKQRHLIEKLQRIGDVADYELEPIMGMDSPYFYRNKTEFTIGKNGVIGFNRMGTHDVVDIPQCCISSSVANVILSSLRDLLKSDAKGVSKITVRTSFSTGETMVILQIPGAIGHEDSLKNSLIQIVEGLDDSVNDMDDEPLKNMGDESNNYVSKPSLESVYVYDRTKKKNPFIHIAGKRTINDEQSGLKFEISPESFYQTNPAQTTKLFDKVREYATPKGNQTILDLYCGVGSIGLTLANDAGEVVGVESVKEAVLNANRNAVINGIINVRYIQGEAENLMGSLNMDEDTIVLVDPPRAGLQPDVTEAIGRSSTEKMIYVSCDPGTLARDMKILNNHGFSLEKIASVDMFPHTSHLETCVLLSRKEPDSHTNVKVEFGEGEG